MSGTGCFHLESSLQYVQRAVPAILVSAIEKEFELGDVEGQVDFGNTAVGANHLPQPGPGAFHGIAMDFAYAIPIQVEGIFTGPVIDDPVLIALTGEEMIDAVAIGVDTSAPLHHLLHDGADGRSLHIAQDEQSCLTASAQQSKDGQAVTVPRATASPFESSLARFAFQFQAASVALQSCGDVDLVQFGDVFSSTMGASERVW